MFISGWDQVGVVGGNHESLHNFSLLVREVRYEVPRDESLPGFGMGMTVDDFQIAEIRHDVTESLKRAVIWSKRHSLQAVELSQRTQAAVQIVSNSPAPSNGGPIYRFWACRPCGPAG